MFAKSVLSTLGVPGLTAVLFVAGCSSSSPQGPEAKGPSYQENVHRAMLAARGNTYQLYTASPDGQGVQVMSTDGAKACAQCEADAVKYAKTGEAPAEVCSMCGAKRTVLTSK